MHGDFSLFDVVGTPRNYKVIDLKSVRKHKCRWVEGRDEWNPQGFPPDWAEFPCSDLYWAAMGLRLWKGKNSETCINDTGYINSI